MIPDPIFIVPNNLLVLDEESLLDPGLELLGLERLISTGFPRPYLHSRLVRILCVTLMIPV